MSVRKRQAQQGAGKGNADLASGVYQLRHWLAAPKEGNFNLTMCNYMLSKEIIEQSHDPPVPTKIA